MTTVKAIPKKIQNLSVHVRRSSTPYHQCLHSVGRLSISLKVSSSTGIQNYLLYNSNQKIKNLSADFIHFSSLPLSLPSLKLFQLSLKFGIG